MPLQKMQDKAFFSRPSTEVAQDLLGKIICRKMEDDFVMRCRITETEAYFGEESICYGFGANKEAGKTAAFYSVGKVCFYCGMLMISCFRQRSPDNVLVKCGLLLRWNAGNRRYGYKRSPAWHERNDVRSDLAGG